MRQRACATHVRGLQRRFPFLDEQDIQYTWTGHLSASRSGQPYFGEVEKGVFAVAGCNGSGVARGTLWGRLLAEMASGERSPILDSVLHRAQPGWHISDLANGDVCAVIGFNGDIVQAATSAKEARNGIDIAYSIPDEGSTLWFDMLVMPKNAPHENNGYAYMNYLLKPQVIANITNSIRYANPNQAANQFVAPAVKQDQAIYPPKTVVDKLFTVEELPAAIARLTTRLWTKLKTNT